MVLEAETTEPPQAGYFAGLRHLCDVHGVVLILDEIITGFRWDARGAQHVYGIEPDLCTFGKGLANGFPVSALAGRRDLMRLGGLSRIAIGCSSCHRPTVASRGRWRRSWPRSTSTNVKESPTVSTS